MINKSRILFALFAIFTPHFNGYAFEIKPLGPESNLWNNHHTDASIKAPPYSYPDSNCNSTEYKALRAKPVHEIVTMFALRRFCTYINHDIQKNRKTEKQIKRPMDYLTITNATQKKYILLTAYLQMIQL